MPLLCPILDIFLRDNLQILAVDQVDADVFPWNQGERRLTGPVQHKDRDIRQDGQGEGDEESDQGLGDGDHLDVVVPGNYSLF